MTRCGETMYVQNGNILFNLIDHTFEQWVRRESITSIELYQFLQTVKDEAEKEKLAPIVLFANDCLSSSRKDKEVWSKKEWQRYISPLIAIMDSITETRESLDQDFILIVDDDVEFVTFTKHLLEKEGFLVVVAPDGTRALKMIYDFKPSLIFIDTVLPDIDGYTLLEKITNKSKKSYTPITMISDDYSKENRIRSYQLGAIDLIAKPIDKEIFIALVQNRLAHKREIEQSVIIDELTGVYNRKYMNTRIEQFFQQFQRDHITFSVALLDLDHFKKVNDTFGHIVGDDVLREFANLANSLKRENDIICRYGGEEFVIVLPNTTAKNTKLVLDRFQTALQQKTFAADNVEFKVTFSAGVTEVSPHNLHIEKLLDEADKALYYAKQSGRNKTALYEHSLQVVKNTIKITIVIVDDSALIRQILMRFFKGWNPSSRFEINVIEFSNGVSFLESDWYNPGEKYIILLDGVMPKMDGLEVLAKIREKYTTDDVLISMLTGRKGEEHVIHALRNGADDYIVKPFDTEEVSIRIQRLIKKVFVNEK